MIPDRRELSDHDLLIRLDVQIGELNKLIRNHLAHHWAVELALATALIGAVAALLFK
jgi:hypothetical protein